MMFMFLIFRYPRQRQLTTVRHCGRSSPISWTQRRTSYKETYSPVVSSIVDLKDSSFKCVYHLKLAFLGYKVNKQGSLRQGEAGGGRFAMTERGKVAVTELHRNSPPLYCLYHILVKSLNNASKVELILFFSRPFGPISLYE